MILNYPGGPNLIISIHKNKEIFLAGSETCNNGMHKKSFGKQQHKKDSKEIQLVHPKGNQSWMFIGRTDIETEVQYFGHLMQRSDSLEKTLMLGKIEGRRRSRWQRMKWLEGIDSVDMNLSKLREIVKDSLSCCSPWGHKESDMTERLNNTRQARKTGVIVSNSQYCYKYIMELWILSA